MSKVNIQPLADRVLIEPAAAETKTSSGIIIPDSAKEKPQKGTVVAVGPGTKETSGLGGPFLAFRRIGTATAPSRCGTGPIT